MKNKKTSFSAVVELPYNYSSSEVTVDVELDKDEEHLTYDEVENAIFEKVDKLYKCIEIEIDDYRNCPKILDIVINADNGESYPVVSESEDTSKLDANKEISKYLVLPYARYTLTPEAQLWMQLRDEGIIDYNAPFDFEKYHSILEKRV